MKCPNCSAECSDNARECDFCGHPFVDAVVEQRLPPVPPTNPNRATFSASEPTITPPPSSYVPPPVQSDNPYAASYPSSAKPPKQSFAKGSVPNYLVWAILATLCCCLPTGIAAIVYAAQVDGKLAAGDYEGALAASNNAKMWSWISVGGYLLVFVLYLMLFMSGALGQAGRY